MTIPVTIIGGYLGAGKTTLINRVLGTAADLRGTAVLVNDFGDVNIDAELIRERSPDGKVIALSNGCVCCTIQDDFTRSLDDLRKQDVTHVLLEASGIASPGKLRRQCAYPGYHPRGCIVLVDGKQYPTQATDKYVGQLVRQQVAEADMIVVTKQEDEAPIALPDFEQPRLDGTDSAVLELLLDPSTPLAGLGRTLPEQPVAFTSLTLHQCQETTYARLEQLLASLAANVTRVKGFVHTERGDVLVQKAGSQLELEVLTSTHEPDLVFIFADADAATFDEWKEWQVTSEPSQSTNAQ